MSPATKALLARAERMIATGDYDDCRPLIETMAERLGALDGDYVKADHRPILHMVHPVPAEHELAAKVAELEAENARLKEQIADMGRDLAWTYDHRVRRAIGALIDLKRVDIDGALDALVGKSSTAERPGGSPLAASDPSENPREQSRVSEPAPGDSASPADAGPRLVIGTAPSSLRKHYFLVLLQEHARESSRRGAAAYLWEAMKLPEEAFPDGDLCEAACDFYQWVRWSKVSPEYERLKPSWVAEHERAAALRIAADLDEDDVAGRGA